jgi:hypothetical protein
LPDARAQEPSTRQFEDLPCPLPLPEGLTEGKDIVCGYVTVPEDHADPDSEAIQLAVAILRSPAAQPASDPLIILQGGPGTSALSTLVHLMASPFGEPFLAEQAQEDIRRESAARQRGIHRRKLDGQRGRTPTRSAGRDRRRWRLQSFA